MKIIEEPSLENCEMPINASTQTQWAQVVSPRVYNLHTDKEAPDRQVQNLESMDSRGQVSVCKENNSNTKANEKIEPGYIGPFQCHPMQMRCPQCKNAIRSITTSSPNALCLFSFGLCSMCFDECKDVEHRCPKCNAFLGIYDPWY